MENRNRFDEEKGIFDAGGDDQRPDRGPRRFQRRRQNQTVPDYIDWKDVDFLRRFIPERGKIMPRRISGVSAKDQRRIAKAIKRARAMALLPYVAD
jgi:small subunit ribosomal protein S18